MLCRAILLLLLLFLATVAAVNHDRCTANQTRGLILSCETSCVKSQHVCTLGSACVCKNGLFRDQKTGLCVLPGECPRKRQLFLVNPSCFFTLYLVLSQILSQYFCQVPL
ncbi:uncharacterized protein LOC135136428 isoform X3 [Zophobas morio]|uniref:uncharacterized protein LOC135136428 isoform X3 n=1 Tax=Zophobas morio TaxID=2755281 RepID=UPI0030830BB8